MSRFVAGVAEDNRGIFNASIFDSKTQTFVAQVECTKEFLQTLLENIPDITWIQENPREIQLSENTTLSLNESRINRLIGTVI